MLEVGERLRTHGHAVLIGSHPHTSQLVQIEVLHGDVGQRGLVALDIGELSPLFRFVVEHQYTQVVGGHPEQSIGVVTHLPHQHILRHILESLLAHILRERCQPALLILQINIGTGGVSDYPDVAILVGIHPVVVIGVERIPHIVVAPAHVSVFAIYAHQLSEGRHHEHALAGLLPGRDAKILGELPIAIAEGEVFEIFCLRVEVVESVLIGFHPVAFLRVQIQPLHGTLDAHRVKPSRGLSVHFLCHGVIHRVVHALVQPESSAVSLLYLVYAIVAQRGCILVIREVCPHAIAIVAVQAVACSHPHIAA